MFDAPRLPLLLVESVQPDGSTDASAVAVGRGVDDQAGQLVLLHVDPDEDVHRIGSATIRLLLDGRSVRSLVLSRRQLLDAIVTAEPDRVTVAEAVALAVAHLHNVGDWTDQTAQRMGREMARLAVLLEYMGVSVAADVTQDDIEEFVRGATSRDGAWREPAVATMHLRLSAARLFYRCLRSLHVCKVDPTLDVRLPPKSGLKTRPLTNDEELICRLTSEHTLTETRRPAAWALGQATATTAEQAAIRVCDVDLAERRVWIHGSAKRTPRWGELTKWGISAIAKAIDRAAGPEAGLVYGAQTSAESGTASVCRAVSQVLGDAGYGGHPDVRPGSLAGWAGARIFEETGRIEMVASRMGLTTLDAAAEAIGWDWRT